MKLFNDYWTKADQKAFIGKSTPEERWLVDHLWKRVNNDPCVPPLIQCKSKAEIAQITAKLKRWRDDEEKKRRRLSDTP